MATIQLAAGHFVLSFINLQLLPAWLTQELFDSPWRVTVNVFQFQGLLFVCFVLKMNQTLLKLDIKTRWDRIFYLKVKILKLSHWEQNVL